MGEYDQKEVTIVIENGASLSSDGVLLQYNERQYSPIHVLLPALFTGTTLTFQVSHNGTDYYNLYDMAGEVSAVVAAGVAVALDPAKFFGWNYLRVRSGTAASPSAQAAKRTISLIGRVL